MGYHSARLGRIPVKLHQSLQLGVSFLDGEGVEGHLVHLACCIRLVKSLTASGTLVAGAQYVAGVNVDDPMLDFVQHAKSVVAASVL